MDAAITAWQAATGAKLNQSNSGTTGNYWTTLLGATAQNPGNTGVPGHFDYLDQIGLVNIMKKSGSSVLPTSYPDFVITHQYIAAEY